MVHVLGCSVACGMEPMSLALAGRFLTTAPAGKSHMIFLTHFYMLIKKREGFPGGTVVENLPANAGDTGSSPGLGRSHMPRSN